MLVSERQIILEKLHILSNPLYEGTCMVLPGALTASRLYLASERQGVLEIA